MVPIDWAVGPTTSEPAPTTISIGQIPLNNGSTTPVLTVDTPIGRRQYLLDPLTAGELGSAISLRSTGGDNRNTLVVLVTPFSPDIYALSPEHCSIIGEGLERVAAACRSNLTIARGIGGRP